MARGYWGVLTAFQYKFIYSKEIQMRERQKRSSATFIINRSSENFQLILADFQEKYDGSVRAPGTQNQEDRIRRGTRLKQTCMIRGREGNNCKGKSFRWPTIFLF